MFTSDDIKPERLLWRILYELLGLLVKADEVAVDIDPRLRRLLLPDLLDSEVFEQPDDFLLVRPFGHIDDECAVLDQTAVLTFWGLVRAQPAPLRGVQISGLEVWLAPCERGSHAPQV
jgi:hypothetical protein